MIANELYFGQGLGNQLWNYVVARIIAKQKNCEFSILGRERFKGGQFMDIDFGATLFGGMSSEGGPPNKLPNGITHYYRERRENLAGTTVDISRTDPQLLQISLQTKFDGNCQSIKYLQGHRQDIVQWITIHDEYKKYATDPNACIIHLRCGDFSGLKDVFLPASYYLQAMENINKINSAIEFFCVTDQPEVAKKVLPEAEIIGSAIVSLDDQNKASHHLGGPIGIDFCLMMSAKYLIIPNSSFSWWAAYLNTNKPTIIAPKYWARHNTGDGFWSTSDIITDGFMYQDKEGKLYSSSECWQEKSVFEKLHESMFITASEADLAPQRRVRGALLLARRIAGKVTNGVSALLRKTPSS